MKKTTIKDIAAILNISPHTVSKALNNKPGVGEEMRQQIKQTAQELNYIPNIFGKGLSGKSSKTIGLVLNVTTSPSPTYWYIVTGAEEKAGACGYNVMLCNSVEDIQKEAAVIQMLLEKRVDGMIISPVDHPQDNHNLEKVKQAGIPYVLLARTIHFQQHPCIRLDSRRGAYLAGKYLIEKGHTNILHLTRQYSLIAVEERIEGLKAAFHEKGLAFPEENIYRECQETIENASYVMLKILRERRDFTAVLAYNDVMAFGAMKAVHECRLRIPADVAIMGFDNISFDEISLVPLTTVNRDFYALGRAAVEMLICMIEGRQNECVPALPDSYIVERQSV
ncbi:periplasmic binding protein and sugar binding domain of the LacI [Candidatus Moduliflexus flocculans]|uniref:Periplasmic binding protein and sugar binding domain of the LacI n=1 Tax=Candidatus Moduliflexus flocculans TaxID=1499966 RepID=A0A081BMM0_9BACT|nr:periplasmic binding protein and sugar binding domain of the LacI [Candidatus Moduliflexus flocculans]